MKVGFTFADPYSSSIADVGDYLIRRDAFFTGGDLFGIGANYYGRLGQNDTVDKSSLTSIVASAGNSIYWKQVSAGDYFSAAVKTDGTLWTVGRNQTAVGQLGINSGTESSVLSPVTTSGGGTNWSKVACGSNFSAAIKTDGTLWTWGGFTYGQLGRTNVGYQSPASVSGGGTTWSQASCGQFHAAAIKTDGTLWTWGDNRYGQLGAGDWGATSYRNSPITTIAGGTNWKQVSCGDFHTAAIQTDGTLWVWGLGSSSQLGTTTITNYSSPITVSGGGTAWQQVSCGSIHTAAIKTDGTLWVWGYNGYGRLGTNDTITYSSPVSLISGGGTNWKQVAAGSGHTAAIKTDGTLWTWGYNATGELGVGSISSYSSPVTVIGSVSGWNNIYAGSSCTFAIQDFNY